MANTDTSTAKPPQPNSIFPSRNRLRRWAGVRTFARGAGYARSNKVTELRNDTMRISAVVTGRRQYRVEVEPNSDPDKLRYQCTCPFEWGPCKHVIAVILVAADQASAPAQVPDLAEWRVRLARALGGAAPPPDPAEALAGPHYLYRLELEQRPGTWVAQLRLDPRQVTPGRRGTREMSAITAFQRAAQWGMKVVDGQDWDQKVAKVLGELLQHRPEERIIPEELTGRLLSALATAPRVLWGETQRPVQISHVPATFACEVSPAGDGGLTLSARITVAGDVVELGEEAVIIGGDPPWVFDGNEMFRPLGGVTRPSLAAELLRAPIDVPADEVGSWLAEALPVLNGVCPVALPDELSGATDPVQPVAVLSLREARGALVLEPSFRYGGEVEGEDSGAEVRPQSPGDVVVHQGEWVRRDLAFEQRRCQEINAQPPSWSVALEGDAAYDFLFERLPKLKEKWHVQGEEDLQKIRIHQGTAKSSANVQSGMDWFELEMAVIMGETTFKAADLVQRWREGSRYVQLDDGAIARLPVEWLAKVAPLMDEATRAAHGTKLRVKFQHATLIDELIGLSDEANTDDRFEQLRDRLRNFDGIAEVDVPEGLEAELRGYQKKGFEWALFLRDNDLAGVLADEMGLGKTVQALATLVEEQQYEAKLRADAEAKGEEPPPHMPSLVVAPTSVVWNWRHEAQKFAPGLKVLDLTGPTRHERFDQLSDCDIALTSYALLRRDQDRLLAQPYNYLILDEAQAIKNPAARTARVARRLRADHRLALTGTPLENNLLELWSLFEFLMPGFFGSRDRFRRRVVRPVEKDRDPEAAAALHRRVAPFILRRLKAEVVAELPPKTEMEHACEMAPTQRRLYEKIRDTYREKVFKSIDSNGLEKSQITILDALLKLRQVCIHPQVVKLADAKNVHVSGKFERMKELMSEVIRDGHRMLVFSQFTGVLALVREYLDAEKIRYIYLDGRTRDRQSKVDTFNNDESYPLFLISLKAGGTGLNLTGADHVMHLDPWWNPAVEDQATDRAHRIGQEKPVTVHKLITVNSVEEGIRELQEKKRELFEGVVKARGGQGPVLTRDEVEELFSV